MNVNTRYLVGAGLFCGGLLIGVLATRKHYMAYYQKIADEEIASVKRKYSEDRDKAVAKINDELEQYKADRRVLKANLAEAYREMGVADANDIIAAQGYAIKDEATLDMPAKKTSDSAKPKSPAWYEEQKQLNAMMATAIGKRRFSGTGDEPLEDDDYLSNEEGALLEGDELELQRIKNLNSRATASPKIEIITADTFGDLYTEGYDCETLLYYVGDHTLACEESDMDGHPELIDDVYGAVGNALTDFFDDFRPEEPIYVRNNARSIDYEIIKVCSSYLEAEEGVVDTDESVY